MEYENFSIPDYGVYIPPEVIDAAMALGEEEGAKFLFAVVTEIYSDGPVQFDKYSKEAWYSTLIVAVNAVDLSTGDSYGR